MMQRPSFPTRRPFPVSEPETPVEDTAMAEAIAANIEEMNYELADMSPEALYRDAMRWRGLMTCDGIKAVGSQPSQHSGLPEYCQILTVDFITHAGDTSQSNYFGRPTLIQLAEYMRSCLEV